MFTRRAQSMNIRDRPIAPRSPQQIGYVERVTGGTVVLVVSGAATEISAGAIVARLHNVTADTGIELTSSKNKIKKLGIDTTKKGSNSVTLSAHAGHRQCYPLLSFLPQAEQISCLAAHCAAPNIANFGAQPWRLC
jgi:hypothetical protein